MDTNGILPNSLTTCTFIVYAYSIYGKATKQTCNTKKAISINEYKPVASAGGCVSVNLLVSSTPGLIVQMSGFITP